MKDKRYKAERKPDGHVDSLDALLAESRALREQAADELDREARGFKKMCRRHLGRNRGASDPDERSA